MIINGSNMVSRWRTVKTAALVFCVSFLFLLALFQAQDFANKSLVRFNFGSSSTTSSTGNTNDDDVRLKCRPWFEWTNSYRRCVSRYLQKDKRSAWQNLHEAISYCAGQSTFDMINVNYLTNQDDVKLVIMPAAQNNSSCVEVTLGIGGDTESEQKLLKLWPGCRMYGADPMNRVGRIFENVGKYYEMAVGAKSGVFKASVLVGPGIYDYATKEVPTTAFVDFLTKHIKQKQIDYLFMDNEGAEYDILPLFSKGSSAENNNIVVCQMSVELHGPLPNYGMNNTKYNDLVRNILQSSPFIPIWSTAPANHVRMFLLNAHDKYCVQTYLQKWCFVDF